MRVQWKCDYAEMYYFSLNLSFFLSDAFPVSMCFKHSSTVLQPFVPSDKRETGAKLKFTESVGVCFTVALLLQNHCE